MKHGWLTERPIAHRGLHDAGAGIIENTASAFHAAISHGFGIETDLQISADGEAMVHHDYSLGRLTDGNERLAALPAEKIRAARFKTSTDRILTLGEVCELVAGRVPLVLELKSEFNGDTRIARRTAEVLKTYAGPVAAMSFDPDQTAVLRTIAPALPRGIVVASRFVHVNGRKLSRADWFRLAYMLHLHRTRPNFIAYAADDLPAATTAAARLLGMPLLTWTIRSQAERNRVMRFADQVIFEGFLP